MRTPNLSRRLFLIALVALLPTAAILIYDQVTLRQAQEDEIHASALRMGELVSLEMNQIIIGTESLLRAIASAPVVRRSDGAGCQEYLANMVEQLPQYASIGIIDASGIARCMPNSANEVFAGDRSYFIETMRTGKLVVGEYIDGRVTPRPMLPIAIPLEGTGEWSDGVIVAGLDLGWLGARIKNREYTPQSAITIADRNGRILAREPFPEDFVGTEIPEAYQHLVHAEAPGTLEVTSQDGTRRVIGYFPAASVPVGLYVSAGLSTDEAFAALDRASIRGAAILFTSIVAALFFAWYTSEVLIRGPFARLCDTVAAWRRGKIDARTGMTGSYGELGQIGLAIDEFMDELLAARAARDKAQQQRELLLGELDHRVKNLLATVQAVARQSFRNAGQSDFAKGFLDRLGTMSNAHSLLMRDEWQEATIQDLIETTIAPFNDPKHPQFSLSGPRFMLNSRAILAFGMALHELCTNASKYGALQRSTGGVAINWDVDPGAGAGEEMFTLVWREHGGPPVTPPGAKGFGSRMIEQALANQINGEVTIDYPPEGVVCIVNAPLAVVGTARDVAA